MSRVEIVPAGVYYLTYNRSSPVAREVRRHAEQTASSAKARARVRTGATRRGIYVEDGVDRYGYFARVWTTAQNDQGFGYATWNEKRHPYIRPIR